MTGGPSQQQLQQQQQAWGNLQNIFGSAFGAAGQQGSQGAGTLNDVTQYFQSLLSGNPQALAQASAPAANAATAASDVQKKQQASEGTSRTGGTVAQNQTQADQLSAQIASLIGNIQNQAAPQLSNIGQTELNNMLNALGIGTSASGTVGGQVTSDINTQRQAAAQMWSSLIGGGADIASAAIMK
jgi:hypothetical protein